MKKLINAILLAFVLTVFNQYEEVAAQQPMSENQRQLLIAQYEEELDVYTIGRKVNLNDLLGTAQKLSELDPQNVSIVRFSVYYYRENGQPQKAIEYCANVLESNTSDTVKLEAATQLGDIYYNEYNNKSEAKRFVDYAITLVQRQYTRAQIEEFVNDGKTEVNNMEWSGKTNIIKELYILKSEIEDDNPTFESKTEIEEMNVLEDRQYNIKYRTDWEVIFR